MSEINHDQFEAWINRYLDGELTDNEFEQYLRSFDASLDLEKLRLLRTRIERIEELYRQIEEPAVPDGYWDEFADRVTARLSPDTRPSLKDRILALFSPSRWPNATYRYAGAVASVLVVFLIGKSLMKSGSDEYMPHDFPAAIVEQLPPSSSKQVSDDKRGDIESVVEAEPKQVIEHAEQQDDESEPVQPAISIASEALKKSSSEIRDEMTGADDIVVESDMEIETGAAQSVVETSAPSESIEDLVPPSVDAVVPQSLTEESKIEPLAISLEEPEEKVVADKIERRSETDKSLTYMKTSAVESDIEPSAVSVDRGRTAWNYDNWDLDSLRAQLSLYEELPADSLSADSAFIEIAEIKSSIAFITRDSTDVYDAICAIDSLLIHNPDADTQRWTVRRAHLDRILENLNNR